MPARRPTPLRLALLVLVVVALAWWQHRQGTGPDAPPAGTPPASGAGTEAPTRTPDESALARAVAQKRSGVWVEGRGRIVKVLKDDRDPPRHQRCLAEILDGHTIKISHNIDLASRLPWREGQTVAFRGRFEWNDLGGVVHWTHHDPDGRHEGGWLELDGRRYR